MPHIKEVHFFDNNFNKGIGWYEKFFSECEQVAIGEATPAYLCNKNIPSLIHQYLPNCKLIVSLRDPVSRAYSHYWYRMAEIKKQKNDISFEEYLNNNLPVMKEGLYGESLSRYYKLFPKENILVMRYEDIKLNPEDYMYSVFNFLGVDEGFIPLYLDKVVNSSASRSGSKLMDSVSRKLSKLRLHTLSNLADKFFSKKDIPPLSLEVRRSLIEKYYLDDIKKLEKLTGQDLSSWKN